MIDLKQKYPDIIDKCREWDCGYSEAIKRIEDKNKLNKYIR